MTERFRILHLSSEKNWRGGEKQIASLIEMLSTMGVDNFVAVRKNSVFEIHCKEKKIQYLALPFANTLDIRSAWKLKSYCAQHAIDIVHMHSAKSHGIGVLSATMGNPTPLVLSRRVEFLPKNNRITRWRYNHPSIKAILGVSNRITEIMTSYVQNGAICETIYSGIDISKFSGHNNNHVLRKEFGLDSDHILVGNTSALEVHKDYPTFIQTIKKLKARNMKVMGIIMGKGELLDSLKEGVRESGLSSNVIFTGFRNDVPLILQELDIFLMTSDAEGLGTSILDAFASGVPVVATAAGGIPEMVIDGETGLLCPIGDSTCLSEAVQHILKDGELRSRLVAGAKTKLTEFTGRATAEKTLRVYKRILSNQDNPL